MTDEWNAVSPVDEVVRLSEQCSVIERNAARIQGDIDQARAALSELEASLASAEQQLADVRGQQMGVMCQLDLAEPGNADLAVRMSKFLNELVSRTGNNPLGLFIQAAAKGAQS